MNVIEVKSLTKKFKSPDKKGELLAVDNISFNVAGGEIFGLLGPNGAGKTTTLEIIEGLQQPTSGQTLVKGISTQKELAKVKNLIGIQLQSSAYYEYLKLGEILQLFGSFYNTSLPVDDLLDIVDLKDKKKALIKQLSGGQQQRFSICAALVNNPEIIFLDEPTTGLDPQARRAMWQFIEKINKRGKTIIITTHYMEEAEFLCHRVGIMDKGEIVILDTPKNLVRSLKSSACISFTASKKFEPQALNKIDGVLNISSNDHGKIFLKITKSNEVLPHLYKWAEANGIFMHDLEVKSSNLEDVFLELTGKKLKE